MEVDNGVIFMDDDCRQFCQQFGMHLGYFWCLADLNHLTEDCTQNCEGVGVTMEEQARNTVTPSTTKKKGDFDTTMSLFHHQLKKSRKNSLAKFELNMIRDSISQLSNQLVFMKTKKYEAQKWLVHT